MEYYIWHGNLVEDPLVNTNSEIKERRVLIVATVAQQLVSN